MYCTQCGRQMAVSVGLSSWSEVGLCTDTKCRTVTEYVYSDFGGPTKITTNTLSNIEHSNLYDKFVKNNLI